jgi:hypothetical protein
LFNPNIAAFPAPDQPTMPTMFDEVEVDERSSDGELTLTAARVTSHVTMQATFGDESTLSTALSTAKPRNLLARLSSKSLLNPRRATEPVQ